MDEHASELIRALRASWPRPEALRKFATEYQAELDGAFARLTAEVPNHQLKSVAVPLEEVTITLANGYLSEQAKAGTAGQLTKLLRSISSHGALTEVLLTAGCALNDNACNTRLLKLVQNDVARKLEHRWGPGKASRAIEDLPSHLMKPMQRGYNRGRVRLLDFYGRSSLVSWLSVLAHALAADHNRKTRKEHSSGEIVELDNRVASEDARQEDDGRQELPQVLKDVVPGVVAELLKSLRLDSPRQYQAAVFRLRQGYANEQIAQRMGVSDPAVAQLLDKVLKKFLQRLAAADPRLSDLLDSPASQGNNVIFKAIVKLLQAQPDDPPTNQPTDSLTTRSEASSHEPGWS